MAKTYTEVCPTAQVLILDSAYSVGGVWAKERLYPGLKTNNILGSYEFSDFPMYPERFGMKPGQHIPGQVVHEYLRQFAEHFNLTPLLRFRQKVETAELLDDGHWSLLVSSLDSSNAIVRQSSILTRKLVIATGLTSEPNVPKFRNQETFGRPIIHSKQFQSFKKEVEVAKEIVVLGGNKSAWDAAYWAATEGAHVNLVMRPGGGGPSWVWPVLLSPLKISIQLLATTRLSTWFDPCIWTESDPYIQIKRLLHQTWLGQILVTIFWALLDSVTDRVHKLHENQDTQKLRPWVSSFWMGNSLSIHNYDSNWFDLVRQGRISVHVADVDSLSEDTIHLTNGTKLNADMLICCTGWLVPPPIKILPAHIMDNMGLPSPKAENNQEVIKIRQELLQEYPFLRQKPNKKLPLGTITTTTTSNPLDPSKPTPYRLHRFMIPTNPTLLPHHNLAFIGAHLALSAILVAQIQALWITAYLLNELPHLQSPNLNISAIHRETLRHTEYCAMRHPPEAGGAGERCPDLAFDCLPYIDMLMGDLGVDRLRKRRGGWWREVTGRYLPGDYRGVVGEWMGVRGARGEKVSI